MSDWQPIETAPKDGTIILAFYDRAYGMAQYSVRSWQVGNWGYVKEGWADEWMQVRATDPTHWQPLPEPPEAA